MYHTLRLDVTDVDQWNCIYDHCESVFNEPVEMLVNNAGVSPQLNHNLVLDINLHGVMNGSTAFINRYGKSKVKFYFLT